MMEYGDIGIKDEDDVLLAIKDGATAVQLHEWHGARIAGLIASALDKVLASKPGPKPY